MEAGASEIVLRALNGDEGAWDALVERFAGLVWSVARAHGLNTADASDVCQTTWLRLAEHLGRLREPEAVGGWLATTARREALRTRLRQQRVVLHDWGVDVVDVRQQDVEAGVLQEERHALLWRGIAALGEGCRALLRVLLSDPPPSYQEVSAALDMPVGSIGPTRGRCLQKLRAVLGEAEGPEQGT
jgi:RNA polymerase sigma factor (sigma-70 family)